MIVMIMIIIVRILGLVGFGLGALNVLGFRVSGVGYCKRGFLLGLSYSRHWGSPA